MIIRDSIKTYSYGTGAGRVCKIALLEYTKMKN